MKQKVKRDNFPSISEENVLIIRLSDKWIPVNFRELYNIGSCSFSLLGAI